MTLKDFIEDWIQMRATLQKQIQAIKKSDGQPVVANSEAVIVRLRKCLEEMNALLKEHASVER